MATAHRVCLKCWCDFFICTCRAYAHSWMHDLNTELNIFYPIRVLIGFCLLPQFTHSELMQKPERLGKKYLEDRERVEVWNLPISTMLKIISIGWNGPNRRLWEWTAGCWRAWVMVTAILIYKSIFSDYAYYDSYTTYTAATGTLMPIPAPRVHLNSVISLQRLVRDINLINFIIQLLKTHICKL